MNASRQPLLTRIAADLMTGPVVLVPKQMSVPKAAQLLSQAKISGAPVVDDAGRCIGVISTTDFVSYAKDEHHLQTKGPHSVCSWQILEEQTTPAEQVADYMTQDPVTAAPSARIGDLARTMIDAHIHRIVVVDQHQHPIGIVSSTDILAAVAQADAKTV